MPAPAASIALVGDRSPDVRSHARIPGLLDVLRERDGLAVDATWVGTEDGDAVDGFDGVWVLPGSPYRSEAGALAAIRAAREDGIPFLGTCGGFQHALLELARNAAGIEGAGHAENDPDAEELVVVPLACSLVGQEGRIQATAGSLAARILGPEPRIERYHCSYGPNPGYVDVLGEHGVRFTGHDDAGEVRILERLDHPFFVATLFQPELAGDGTEPHPIVRAFVEAAVARAMSTRVGEVPG